MAKWISNDEIVMTFQEAKLAVVICEILAILKQNKVTIRGMSGEKLIITDQKTGEEFVIQDLGYPI